MGILRRGGRRKEKGPGTNYIASYATPESLEKLALMTATHSAPEDLKAKAKVQEGTKTTGTAALAQIPDNESNT